MKKIRINSFSTYIIFLSLLIFMYMIESTSYEAFKTSVFHNIIQCCAICIAFVNIFFRRLSFKQLLYLVAFNSVGFFCYVVSGNSGLLMTMLAITLMPEGCLDKVLHFLMYEEAVLFLCIVLASKIGFLTNEVVSVNKGSYVASGLTLGFSHPNMLAAQATSIVFLYLCIHKNKLTLMRKTFSLFLIVCIYAISRSRTGLILGLVAILLLIICNKKIFAKCFFSVFKYIYIAILLIVSFCIFTFNQHADLPVVHKMNDVLFNGRIGLASTALRTYGVSAFGQKMDLSIWNKWQFFSLDNGQVMLLINYGVLGFIAYFALIQLTVNSIVNSKEIVYAIVYAIFLTWSIYEGTMYFIGKNFALLFLILHNKGILKKGFDNK